MILTKIYCDICKGYIFSEKENFHRVHIENQNMSDAVSSHTTNVTSFDVCDVCLIELLQNVSDDGKRDIKIKSLEEMEK